MELISLWFKREVFTKFVYPVGFVAFSIAVFGPFNIFFIPFGLILIWFPKQLRPFFKMWHGLPKLNPVHSRIDNPPAGLIVLLGWIILAFPFLMMLILTVAKYLNIE